MSSWFGFVYMMAAGAESTPNSPFMGFDGDEVNQAAELNSKLGVRRMKVMEELLEGLANRVNVLEKESQLTKELTEKMMNMEQENVRLRKENEKLKKEMEEMRGRSGMMNETLEEVKQKQRDWIEVKEQTEQSLRKIMQDQEQEKKEIKEQVVQVIKEKQKFVRTTIDRVKCVVVFGVKESNIPNKLEREEVEKNRLRQVLSTVVGEEEETMRFVEEYHRLGKYEENKDRPIKIKFAGQSYAEEVVSKAWKLAQVDEFKKIWISKDLDMEEREIQRNLVIEAKQKNEQRTEEEKKKFHWRVRDLRMKKYFHGK